MHALREASASSAHPRRSRRASARRCAPSFRASQPKRRPLPRRRFGSGVDTCHLPADLFLSRETSSVASGQIVSMKERDAFDDVSPSWLRGRTIASTFDRNVGYRILYPLGRGGMSDALLALRVAPEGESPVVVKILQLGFVLA